MVLLGLSGASVHNFSRQLSKKIFSAFHKTQLSTVIYANRPMLAIEVRASNKPECDYSKS